MENTNETKLCKHCQTEIPKKAKVCPNCKKKQGGIVKWIIIVVVVILIIAIAGGGSDDKEKTNSGNTGTSNIANNDSEQETELEITYTTCTVDEMVTLLNENALKAENEYQDKYVEVTGRLSTIDSDGNYIALYPVNDEWAFTGVSCYIQNDEQLDKVMEMKVGDTITLKGQITDVGEVLGYYLDIDSIN